MELTIGKVEWTFPIFFGPNPRASGHKKQEEGSKKGNSKWEARGGNSFRVAPLPSRGKQ